MFWSIRDSPHDNLDEAENKATEPILTFEIPTIREIVNQIRIDRIRINEHTPTVTF
jgi:hypothetical protein